MPLTALRTTALTVAERTLPTKNDFPQNRRDWLSDLIAGLTVGVIALPLAMGFGIASGAGAAPGIITAIVAGVVAAIFGGSNLQVSGPTGAMTVVLLPAVAEHGIAAAPTLAILAGVMVLLGGWLGLGRAVNYIPWPVIEGFTFGIAAIIFMQQIPLVVDVAPNPDEHNTLKSTIKVLYKVEWSSVLPLFMLAALVMVVMALIRHYRPALPGSLIAIALATLLNWSLDLAAPTIGEIPFSQLINPPKVPTVSIIIEILPAAVIIALLAALESLLSARVADGMSSTPPSNPDRELVGQGLANIASGAVGGLPATGAIARTAVNARAGARTRMASTFHGLILLGMILGASKAIAIVPLAALAGVLMMTSLTMVDRNTVVSLMRHAGRSTALVFVVTAGTTILFDLARAVQVGVLVTAILVLRISAHQSGIREEEMETHIEQLDHETRRALLEQHVMVYRLKGSLFFGAAQRFVDDLAPLPSTRVIILRMGALHVLDITGAQVLADTIKSYSRRGITVLLCGVRARHTRMLAAVGVPGAAIKRKCIFNNLDQALEVARQIADHNGVSPPR